MKSLSPQNHQSNPLIFVVVLFSLLFNATVQMNICRQWGRLIEHMFNVNDPTCYTLSNHHIFFPKRNLFQIFSYKFISKLEFFFLFILQYVKCFFYNQNLSRTTCNANLNSFILYINNIVLENYYSIRIIIIFHAISFEINTQIFVLSSLTQNTLK